MACPLLWYGRPPDIGNKYPAIHRRFRKTGADYLFTVCYCHLSCQILSSSFFYSEIMKYATRILVCAIAVSKSQEFLLKVRRRFFRRRRRRLHVDASSTTSYTMCSSCAHVCRGVDKSVPLLMSCCVPGKEKLSNDVLRNNLYC